MTPPPFVPPVCLLLTVTAMVLNRGFEMAPGWFGILRTVMMVLGGLVVVAIILIVAVAIISGVMGMAGRLRGRR